MNSGYVIIGLYMLVVIGIGMYFSREKQTSANYLLGGRSMRYGVIGIAIMMSLFSSISLVQTPGETYTHGLSLFAIPTLLTLLLSIPAYLLFVRFYFKLGSFTPYEYLEYRYDSTVRAVVAVSSFYIRVMYLAMVVYSTSKIFEGAYGWPAWLTILLAGGIGILCAVTGGSKAVVWIDLFQFFVVVASFITIVVILSRGIDGGAVEAVRTALADGRGISEYGEKSFYTLTPYVRLICFMLVWSSLVSILTAACSDQITIQRLLSTRNWRDGLKSQAIAVVLGTLFTLILFFVGMALYTYYKQNPGEMLTDKTGDLVFFHYVATHLPAPLLGLFIAAMLAAVMSTLSSGLNAMAAVWLKEIHIKFINRGLLPEREVGIAKLATLIIGIIACALAFLLDVAGRWLSQSLAEVGAIFFLLGSAILPAFLFAVFSKRANSRLIWGFVFFSFGEGVTMNIWYALSRAARQAWELDHTLPWGWAGKLPIGYFLLPTAAGALLIVAAFLFRRRLTRIIFQLTGLLVLGGAEGMGLWWLCSNMLIKTEPLARSFQYVPPISLVLATAALFFFPKQPREKYQGLTLGTLNQPLFHPEGKQ